MSRSFVMFTVSLSDFDIEQIALSGQCFRMNPVDDGCWRVAALGHNLVIRQSNKICEFDCDSAEFEDTWLEYFDLQTDYSLVKKTVYESGDPYLIRAVDYGYGIRILRQDLWEVVVSYIISQRNNINRIKNTVERLCAPFNGMFPSAVDLSNYSEIDFQQLGLGYRAKYVYDVVQAYLNGILNLNELKQMSYANAVDYIKQFNGVGDKVANCIALFGLHKTEAFPIDVWIQRIIDLEYGGHFDYQKFGQYAGIVQQYMFFYERLGKKSA